MNEMNATQLLSEDWSQDGLYALTQVSKMLESSFEGLATSFLSRVLKPLKNTTTSPKNFVIIQSHLKISLPSF